MPSDYFKKYYNENIEKFKETSKKYYANNPDYFKNYYIENREKIKNAVKEYYANNTKKCKQYNKEYYQKKKNGQLKNNCENQNNTMSLKQKKQNRINAKLAELLVKKEAFKKKLAEEAAALNNNVTIV
jgi:hypothetical protein